MDRDSGGLPIMGYLPFLQMFGWDRNSLKFQYFNNSKVLITTVKMFIEHVTKEVSLKKVFKGQGPQL